MLIEKSMHREGSVDTEVHYNNHHQNDDMMKSKTAADESLLEYGPGIVRKLRSRYQSLALRQSNGRPSLRRSTSLENILDDGPGGVVIVSSPSPSPIPRPCNESNIITNGISKENVGGVRGNYMKHGGDNHKEQNQLQYQQNNRYRSSRQGHSDYYKSNDRMRRARSVDALHSRKEDNSSSLIEKFKTVVLPKEEIVIIEVSPQPQADRDIYGKYYGVEDKFNSSNISGSGRQGQLQYQNQNQNPQQVQRSSESTGQLVVNGEVRVRSVASPEHELPPPDIVRETARIFEKNNTSSTGSSGDNSLSSTNNSVNTNHLINAATTTNLKKVGHALRMNKSSSVSPSPSPTPSSPSAGSLPNGLSPLTSYQSTATPNAHCGGKLNNTHHQHLSTTGAQGCKSEAAPAAIGSCNANLLSATKPLVSSTPQVVPPISPKQIGIIRPTVNGGVAPVKPTSLNLQTRKVPVPDVSPIAESKPLSVTKKPPLSPKPIFTSSPKNIFLVQDGKNCSGRTATTDGPVAVNEVPVAKPPPPVPSRQAITPITNNSIAQAISNSRPTPTSRPSPTSVSEKETRTSPNMMEFQQISLRPVPKPVDDNLVVNNNVKNVTKAPVPSANPVSVATTVVKTEPKKQPESTPVVSKPQIVASTPKSQQQPAIVPRTKAPVEKSSEQERSQLRTHQQQVSEQKKQKAAGGGTMVFDFTKRAAPVPDYIEDDGLHKNVRGAVTTESRDDEVHHGGDTVDGKLIHFEGGNIIINGRSSLQKKPKSQKVCHVHVLIHRHLCIGRDNEGRC